jgi:thiol:disulfide interchange protein
MESAAGPALNGMESAAGPALNGMESAAGLTVSFGQAVRSGPVEARLVGETATIRRGAPFTVALLLKMDPAWHVYWKNPGDSGLPTTIDWDLPAGFHAGPISWPVPERILTEGLVTYGYSGQVLLLTEITPPPSQPAGSIVIKAKAGWLACRVECTPGEAELSLTLPVTSSLPARDPRWEELFRLTRARLPRVDAAVSFSAKSDGKRIILTARGPGMDAASTTFFYPSVAGTIKDSSPQVYELSAGQLVLRLDRPAAAPPLMQLDGLLVSAGPGGLTVHAPVAPLQRSPAGAAGTGSLLLALLLAFAGGILLNLMPCVLPVISLKVLSFARQAGTEGSTAFRHGLFFAAGVVVSFWLIVAILAALRAAGHLLGWGFQFQDPIVVAITAVLFFLIGLNLFGVFEIGAGFTRMGARLAGRGGAAGSFLSGLFATAVATPCTAPFMGSAIGYALARPLPVAFGVFTALALGMAAPYLLLSASPRLIARLPKPGKWMETLRQVMGFPMMGAVIWMLFVFAALSGTTAMVALLAALLVGGLGAWIWGKWGSMGRARGSRVAAGIAAVLLVAGAPALALLSFSQPVSSALRPAASADAFWQEWSPERVETLRGQGTPVFIDFTARWCLSCQVNEKVALGSAVVRRRMTELGVAALRADWTDKNDAIARAIAGYGRAGVPVYVYYPSGAREPVLLPELLTPGIVLGALNEAP